MGFVSEVLLLCRAYVRRRCFVEGISRSQADIHAADGNRSMCISVGEYLAYAHHNENAHE